MTRPAATFFAAAAFALVAAACSSSDDGTSGTSGTSGTTTPSACASDTRKDTYIAGLSKPTAGALSVKLVEATPAPPAKQSNTLMLQVVDTAGAPVEGATLSVTPFMPDHGHGSSVKPTVTPKGGGTYEVTNVYLPMPGLWRLTVTVQMPNVAPQDAAFSFCIDG
jgi:hypothetical protein